jgi:CRP-like cAMP-binding protein
MDTAAVVALLQKQPFVQGFSQQQVDKLATLAKEEHFESDRILFREGEECSEFYLIISGSVALEMAPPGGTFRVETLGAGDEFGWSSLLAEQGRLFQARVLRDTRVLAFEGTDLRAMCDEDTAFGYEVMRRLLVVVAGRLQATRLYVVDNYWPAAKKAGA